MLNSDAEAMELAVEGLRRPAACAAVDLKSILNSIADQISAADQRHAQALAEMHHRLDHFGIEAASLRAGAAPDSAQAYSRVEQRISDLAARLASAGSPRDASTEPSPYANGSSMPVPTAPAALRSAVPGDQPGSVTGRQDRQADTFDMVGDDEPLDGDWDRHAADALANAYDGQGPAAHDHDHGTILGSAIEDRFSTIAHRIEQYVDELRPMQFADLGARFQHLEARLDEALSVHPSAGIEGLSVLEAQIAEVSRHIEASQDQFARLDVIESELRHLADNIAEDHLADVIRRNAPAQPNLDDLALVVAEHVASSLNRGGQNVDHAGEMQSLVQSLVEEHRHGTEQTATVLDTVQQAMIRLLDRMDALESAQFSAEPAAARASAQDQVSAFSADHEYDRAEANRLAAAFDMTSHTPLHHGAPTPSPAPQRPVASTQQPPAQPERGMYAAESLRAAGPTLGPIGSPPELGHPHAGPESPRDSTSAAIARTRSELLASARRAKELGEGATSDGSDAPGHGVGHGSGKQHASLRPSRLTLSLVALFALGVGFTAVSLFHGRADVPVQTGADTPSSPIKPSSEDGRLSPQIERESAPGPKATAPDDSEKHALADDDTDGANQRQASLSPPATPVSATPNDANGRVVSVPRPADMPPLAIGPLSLRTAALQGDASAQFEVGSRLAEGKGLPQDLASAVAWYEKSAAKGFIMAQYRLGTHYERGLGVKADLARAAAWYQRAAEQGNVKAMHNLAVLSAARDQSTPDYPTAVKWFSSAAGYGLTDSQFNLAVFYESGVGTARDLRGAYKWFSIAAATGDGVASKRRDGIKARLDAKTVADVDSEVALWRPLPTDPIANDPRMAGEIWKRRDVASDTPTTQQPSP